MKYLISFVALFFTFNSFANSLTAELNKVKAEKQKIQNYISQGQNDPELTNELKRLTNQENKIRSRIRQEKAREMEIQKAAAARAAKKAAAVKKRRSQLAQRKTVKPQAPTYSLDSNAPIQDQYQMVLGDLKKEEEALGALRTSLENGVDLKYLKQPMEELKTKISAIKMAKSRIERKLASTGKAEVKPELKIGAMLDFYYLNSFGRGQEGTDLSGRNYDRRHNDFTMNLFEIYAEGTMGDVSIYADLDFGDFADQNSGHGNDTSDGSGSGDPVNHNIGQAYLTYNFSDNFSISAGKMYTHVGYEVAKAMENYNYSRSFAFSLAGPFWHEGLAIKYNTEGGVGLGFFVYDNWDSTTENNGDKTLGLQLGYSNDSFHFLFNAIQGPEGTISGDKRTVYEFNTELAVSDSLSIALNGVLGSEEKALTNATSGDANVDKEWSAWVLYLNWKATDKWTFTPRFELFNDDSTGAATDQYIFSDMGATEGNSVKGYTLTANYQANDWTQFRVEYRMDQADQEIWSESDGTTKDTQNTLGFAWLVKI